MTSYTILLCLCAQYCPRAFEQTGAARLGSMYELRMCDYFALNSLITQGDGGLFENVSIWKILFRGKQQDKLTKNRVWELKLWVKFRKYCG